MALVQHAAGVLGLSSAEVGLKAWMQPAIQPHPWVVARFLPERGELRINIIKNHKFPDGTQKVLVTDYTPQHGRWHVVRRMFRDKSENGSPDTRGIDPFYPKHMQALPNPTDPVFYNMNIAAAPGAVGQAMMKHQAHPVWQSRHDRIRQQLSRHAPAHRGQLPCHLDPGAMPRARACARRHTTCRHPPQHGLQRQKLHTQAPGVHQCRVRP